MNLSNSWHLVITFLGTLGTVTAGIQTNSDLTGSGTPGWSYLVGLGLSALTTFLVAKKADPRVKQFELLIEELEKAVEAANAAEAAVPSTSVPTTTPGPTPTAFGIPILPALPVPAVVNDVVHTSTDILSEINKVIETFKVTQK